MREIRYIEAIREAQQEEMHRDESVFMFGEGIGPRGGCWTQTKGMWPQFGERRLIDVPLSENGFVGLAIFAAATGLRPIVDMMFWDFANEAFGQIVNQAARIRYLSNGQFSVPIVIHGATGIGRSAGGHHSGRLYPAYCNMPGLKVILPSTPYDAKGLLKTAIRDDDPVLIFEHRALIMTTGPVPENEYTESGQVSTDVRYAASVAAFGQLLRGGTYTGEYTYDDVIKFTPVRHVPQRVTQAARNDLTRVCLPVAEAALKLGHRWRQHKNSNSIRHRCANLPCTLPVNLQQHAVTVLQMLLYLRSAGSVMIGENACRLEQLAIFF